MLRANDRYIVTIEDTNIFANGVCHIDNFVVFVLGAIKGEECQIEITKVYPRYAYAKCIKILKASTHRINPKCPYYKKCGGCTFSFVSQELENLVKEQYVKSAFAKHGINVELEKIKCPVSENYRNKVILFYDGTGFGYMEQGTNRIVPHTMCLLNEPVFDRISEYVSKNLSETPLRALYLRKTSESNPQIMVSIIFYKKTEISTFAQNLVKAFPEVKTVLVGVSSSKEFVLESIKLEKAFGDGYIYDTLCGLRFRISPESFYQINHKCAEQLYEKAIELSCLNKNSICADLFCGTGTIGIISAHKTGAQIYGVEIVEKSIEDAKYNAKLNKIENISLEAMDAGKFNQRVDVCIIDPPRKGCSPLMIETLLRLLPNRIVYISCNVDTMARDISLLQKHYKIATPVSPFNLFPRTSHVESVVCLTRK